MQCAEVLLLRPAMLQYRLPLEGTCPWVAIPPPRSHLFWSLSRSRPSSALVQISRGWARRVLLAVSEREARLEAAERFRGRDPPLFVCPECHEFGCSTRQGLDEHLSNASWHETHAAVQVKSPLQSIIPPCAVEAVCYVITNEPCVTRVVRFELHVSPFFVAQPFNSLGSIFRGYCMHRSIYDSTLLSLLQLTLNGKLTFAVSCSKQDGDPSAVRISALPFVTPVRCSTVWLGFPLHKLVTVTTRDSACGTHLPATVTSSSTASPPSSALPPGCPTSIYQAIFEENADLVAVAKQAGGRDRFPEYCQVARDLPDEMELQVHQEPVRHRDLRRSIDDAVHAFVVKWGRISQFNAACQSCGTVGQLFLVEFSEPAVVFIAFQVWNVWSSTTARASLETTSVCDGCMCFVTHATPAGAFLRRQ